LRKSTTFILSFSAKVKQRCFYFTFSAESKITSHAVLLSNIISLCVSRREEGRKWQEERGGGT
jgi:hypothetical protein